MGDKPKLTQNTRKINVVNKCDKSIRLITTISGDPYVKSMFENEYNENYYCTSCNKLNDDNTKKYRIKFIMNNTKIYSFKY